MPSPSEPRFPDILTGALTTIWRNAPVIAGLAIVGWGASFGLQALVRAAETAGVGAANVASLTLVAAVVAMAAGALTDSVLFQRLLRGLRAEPGGVGDDIAAGLGAGPRMIAVSLPMAAPDLLFTGVMLGASLLPGDRAQYLVGPLGFAVLVATVLVLLNWQLAPLLMLDRGLPPADALRASQVLMRGRRWLIARLMLIMAPLFLIGVSLLQVSIQVTTGEAAPTPGETQPIPLIAVAQFLALAEIINSVWRVLVFQLYAGLRHAPATPADAFE